MEWIQVALWQGGQRFRLRNLNIPDAVQTAFAPHECANTGDSASLLKIARVIVEWALQVVVPDMTGIMTRSAQEPHALALKNVCSTWSESDYTAQNNTDLNNVLLNIARIYRPGQGGKQPIQLGKALDSISYLLEGAYPTNASARPKPTPAADMVIYAAVILWVHRFLCGAQANNVAIDRLMYDIT